MKQETYPYLGADKITAGSHSTVWIGTVEPLAFEKLEFDTETDVVIVGGGIAGISIAYCLIKSGKNVIVVDDGFVGSGETGRTTAHLVTALDDRYYELERMFGKENASLVAQSHIGAIDFVEETVKREKIDCDFERVDGYLFLHPSDTEESIDKEYDSATAAGINMNKVTEIPGLKNYSGQALKFKHQAQFHPLKYLKGLCDVITKSGGRIYTNTHAKEIKSTGILTDGNFNIKAKHIVVATNSPVNNKFVMHLKQYAYRTYVIAAKINKDSLPHSLWWDTGNFNANEHIPPYHYVRVQTFNNEFDLLIIGGEDHPTGLADIEHVPEEQRYSLLEEWGRSHFDFEEVVYKWSGQVMEPMDSLAYIGKNPFDSGNIYIATGDSGNGMTYGTIAGMLISDMINEKENKFEKIYSPKRFNLLHAGNVFLKEFVGGFSNYRKVIKSQRIESDLDNISIGEGKIIEMNKKKYGVFCDEANRLHFVGSECTHLGCGLIWNNDEKSWDCPCHGSRFSYEGKVLNGPAITNLEYHQEMKPNR